MPVCGPSGSWPDRFLQRTHGQPARQVSAKPRDFVGAAEKVPWHGRKTFIDYHPEGQHIRTKRFAKALRAARSVARLPRACAWPKASARIPLGDPHHRHADQTAGRLPRTGKRKAWARLGRVRAESADYVISARLLRSGWALPRDRRTDAETPRTMQHEFRAFMTLGRPEDARGARPSTAQGRGVRADHAVHRDAHGRISAVGRGRKFACRARSNIFVGPGKNFVLFGAPNPPGPLQKSGSGRARGRAEPRARTLF